MNDAKRTPGEWKQLASLIYSVNGMVCELSEPRPGDGMVHHERIALSSPDWNEAMANGRFIVRAHNAHDALVAVSRALVAYLDEWHSVRGRWIGNTPEDRELLRAGKQAKAAITLATEAAT